MQVSEVIGCITEIYQNGKNSVLLLGSPGIGKSTVIEEACRAIAKAIGKEFVSYSNADVARILDHPEKYFVLVDFRLTEVEPSDLLGIPGDVDIPGLDIPAVTYKPLLWAICLSKASGVLFLDELTNVQRPDVQSATYKLVLDKSAGFTDFSDGTMVVAAGNSPEDSSLANLLPAPLVDRLVTIDVDRPTLAEWSAWMDAKFGATWDRKALAYLSQFPDDFLRLPADPETLDNFPTPRSWTSIARIVTHLSERYRKEYMIGELGDEVGLKFFAFSNAKVPDLSQLFASPKMFDGLDLDGKYLAATFCGTWMREQLETQQSIGGAVDFLEHVAEERREFLVLAIVSTGDKRNDAVIALLKENKLKEAINEIVKAQFAIGGR